MDKEAIEILTINKAVFTSYAFWAAILVLKMIFMSMLTGIHRFRKRVRKLNTTLYFRN